MSDVGAQAAPATPLRQACEVDFLACDVNIPTAPRFDADPMQLEVVLGGIRQLALSTDGPAGLQSPDLAPARMAQSFGPTGFVGAHFDASPSVREGGPLPANVDCALDATRVHQALGFDVMELEFQASSNPHTSNKSGNEDNTPMDAAAHAVSLAAIQERLEARICQGLQTPVLRLRPRLRRSRTPASIHSIRCSGRLGAKPRAATSTMLLKKLGIHVDADAVDSEIERKFKETLTGPMSDGKKQAFQILFSGDLDPTAMDLDMAGLDAVEA